jgi:hypothetical protein
MLFAMGGHGSRRWMGGVIFDATLSVGGLQLRLPSICST